MKLGLGILVLGMVIAPAYSCNQTELWRTVDTYDRDDDPGATERPPRSAFVTIHAEDFDYNNGCRVFDMCGVQEDVDCIFLGDTFNSFATGYDNIDFGSGAASVKFSVACDNPISSGTSRIDIRLDDVNGTVVGSVVVGFTGGGFKWIVIETFLDYPILGGIHDLYLTYVRDCDVFNCGTKCGVANIDWFIFYPIGV